MATRQPRPKAELLIITGLSGSGKGSVIRALEDLGYYSVDNLPIELIPKFAELTRDSPTVRCAALVVDIREGARLDKLPHILASLRRQLKTTVLFLEADEDALALLAEAGDGSIRDALSILDQAIASCNGRLTADAVRQLAGTAPSAVLEEVMQAVARSSSEDVLRLVDRLISEGHSPTHFARQMVRFLRNTVVAKIAGGDSSLLQISGDERTRVARVAQLFSEEDLTRHLQIMLRTHGELGYRQEQRFHLELGLLKMSHAQRLLPIEELLSAAGATITNGPRTAGRPTVVPDAKKLESPTPARARSVRNTVYRDTRSVGPSSIRRPIAERLRRPI